MPGRASGRAGQAKIRAEFLLPRLIRDEIRLIKKIIASRDFGPIAKHLAERTRRSLSTPIRGFLSFRHVYCFGGG
jgi:hypothetical protein